jgi:hypothetical protein
MGDLVDNYLNNMPISSTTKPEPEYKNRHNPVALLNQPGPFATGTEQLGLHLTTQKALISANLRNRICDRKTWYQGVHGRDR